MKTTNKVPYLPLNSQVVLGVTNFHIHKMQDKCTTYRNTGKTKKKYWKDKWATH